MNKKNQKRISVVGRRTGVDIVPCNRLLKLNEEGLEHFGDYWESSDSSSEASHSHMNSSPIGSGAPRISSFFVKNSGDANSERISFINFRKPLCLDKQSSIENTSVEQPLEKSNCKITIHATNKIQKDKRPYTKGRRTGINVIGGKEIHVAENVDDFNGYWTDSHSKFVSEIDGTRSNKESNTREKFIDIQTSTALSNTHSVENSEVTSTTEDFKCDSLEKLNSCSLETTPIKSSNTMIQLSTPRCSNRTISKYGKTSVEGIVLDTSSNMSKENINQRGKISELKNSTFQIAKQRKTSLSISPLRIKNDKIQFVPLNNTFSKDKIENSNKKEKTNNSQAEFQEMISFSFKNKMDKTQPFLNDASSENSHKTMSQDSETPKSTVSNSQMEKVNKTLSASKNKDKNVTRSPVLDYNSQISKQKEKTSSAIVLNDTFSEDEAENTNENEKINSTPVQMKKVISSSASISLHNNKTDQTQTFLDDAASENLHETMSQNAKPSKLTNSKSQVEKGEENLSASTNKDKTDGTPSIVSDCTSFSSQIAKQKETSLSASPMRVQNGEIQTIVLNNTFSRDNAENTNRKEEINSSQVQIEQIIASSASLSHNNKMDRTQTFPNDASSENAHETMNQTAKTPKSTDSKTRMRKRKKTLSTSRKRCKTNEAESPDLDNMSSSSRIVKQRKTSLSTSSMRVEKDEKQSVSNRAFSTKKGKNNRTKNSQARKQNNSVSASCSLLNNEMDGSQIPVNDTLFETMTSNKAKRTSEVEIEKATSSGISIGTSNSKQKVKTLNSKSKTGKRKPPLSTTPENCSEMSGLKRSCRTKVAPLESWRLERRVFGYKENGEIINLGYEQGFPEYKSELKIHSNKPKPTTKKKRPQKEAFKLNDNSINWKLIKSNINKTSVSNPYTGGEELIYLHRPFDTLLWSTPSSVDGKDPPYTVAKSLSGELISFGYVEIEVSKKKEEQFSPSDNITFTVVKGNIKICINKQEISLKEFDEVTVPSGNGYSIKNTGKVPALISFCTYKVPLFDYQFSENSEETV